MEQPGVGQRVTASPPDNAVGLLQPLRARRSIRAGLAEAAAHDILPSAPASPTTGLPPRVELLALVALGLQLIAMVVFSAVEYHRFALTRDFANYAQAWSAIGHGNLDPRSSIVGVPFWQNNAEFVMWPLALLSHLYPHPVVLLWVQDVAVVLTELVTFRWISQVVGRPGSGLSVRAQAAIGAATVLALVANPWVYETIAFDFHVEPLAALFAVLVARDVWEGRAGRLRWWVPLALACDVFGGVYLVGVGISAMLAGRRTRRTGALLAAGGGAWLVLLTAIGGAGVGGTGLKVAYGYLVGPHRGRIGPFDVVTAALTHPGSVLHVAASHLPVVLGMFVTVGLIGFFSSWGIGMATVVLLPNLLDGSGLFLRYPASFQSWPAMPFVLVGSVMVVIRVLQHGERGRKAAVALATAWVTVAGVLATVVIPTAIPEWVAVDPTAAAVLARTQPAIPPGAEVIASQGIVGRFAERASVHAFETGGQAFPIEARTVVFILTARQGVGDAFSGSTSAMRFVQTHLRAVQVRAGAGVYVFDWTPPPNTVTVTLP
jgi:hypothetical protein